MDLFLVACWTVMQFGGQHPGGIPAVGIGMAFPGYVAQPQGLGLGNSEMTWYSLFSISSFFPLSCYILLCPRISCLGWVCICLNGTYRRYAYLSSKL